MWLVLQGTLTPFQRAPQGRLPEVAPETQHPSLTVTQGLHTNGSTDTSDRGTSLRRTPFLSPSQTQMGELMGETSGSEV